MLLTPTLANPPLKLGVMDMGGTDLDAYCRLLFDALPFTPLFNITGCPAMSVPLSRNASGLPVGVQFGARFGNEATLLRLAAQLEQAHPWFEQQPVID